MTQEPHTPEPRATLTSEYQRDWPAYFEAVKDQPARATCVLALDLFEREGRRGGWAIDVACGEGRDTRAMLARGFDVLAIDASEEGLARLAARVEPGARVRIEHARMEDVAARFALEVARADCVNASFALPFCDPAAFSSLWAWIVGAIRPGGRFAGQFFGDRDEWASVRPASHHTRAQVEQLLLAFDVEHLDEVEKEGSDAMGGVKRHHLFHVVARKRGAGCA